MPIQQGTSDADWANFSARLRAYVARRVSPVDADDITGDILVRLVAHRDKLDAADNPLAWIYRVARNAIIDHYRRKGSQEQPLFDVPETVDARDEQPATTLSNCVVPFIDNLPDRYAQALTLTEIEGLTQRAAAERLGLSVSGLKSRVQRGRRKLKDAVLRCCAVEADHRGTITDYRPRKSACISCANSSET